jgi:hypothetical protein
MEISTLDILARGLFISGYLKGYVATFLTRGADLATVNSKAKGESVVRLAERLLTHYYLRADTELLLQVPATRRSFGDRAFFTAGPTLWNRLPQSIKAADNLPSF